MTDLTGLRYPKPYPGGPLDDTPLEHIRSANPFPRYGPMAAGLHIPLPNGRGWVRAKLNDSHFTRIVPQVQHRRLYSCRYTAVSYCPDPACF